MSMQRSRGGEPVFGTHNGRPSAEKQILGFKPAPPLEQVGDEHSEQVQDRKRPLTYGGQSWLRRRPVAFFSRCCCETAMLEEGVSDYRHKRMTVNALP
jgi:hypothetical protein